MKNYKSFIVYSLLFIWPFIYFFPMTNELIVIGNDFDLIYFSYKKYIFEFFQEGRIPFWSPVEGAGFSLIYNPFAQFFYLPSWILYLISSIKGTFSLYGYMIYTILGISIYLFGQFLWLKSFKYFSKKNIFLITLIVPTILIFSNFLRFPNAIHTICWLPYLLLGINYSLFKNNIIKSSLLIFFSTLLIYTAGYPYFVIYIFVFTCFYTLFVLSLVDLNFKKIINFILKISVPSLISFLISLPWLYGVAKTLEIAQDRNLHDYNYATSHSFNLLDIIGSWFYPIVSNTEGRYYFGIILSFLIIRYLFYFLLNFRKIDVFEKKLFIFILISFLFISTIASSKDSHLFNLLWNQIEFIQNMRSWPRINILLVPIISLLGLLSLKLFFAEIKNISLQQIKIKRLLFFSNSILIIIFCFQLWFYLNNIVDPYWNTWHEKRFIFAKDYLNFPLNEMVMFGDGRINLIATITTFLMINLVYFLSRNINLFYLKNIVLFFILLNVVSEQFLNSNFQWSLKEWKTKDTKLEYLAMDNLNKNFNSPRSTNKVYGNNYFRDNTFSINNFLNWGNKFHNEIFWNYFTKNGELKKLTNREIENIYEFYALNSNNKKIFFSNNINFKNPINFIDHSKDFEIKNNINYEIIDFDNNFITIKFISDGEGWINYIDNYDSFWTARINGDLVAIEKLMNTYKSIKYLPGNNILNLKYEPFKF